MRIHLHVGLEKCGTTSLQFSLARNRAELAKQGILYPLAPGKRNHAALAMVCSDPERPDNLRIERGLQSPADQAAGRAKLIEGLQAEIDVVRPSTLILSNEHCSSRLFSEAEIARLRDLCLEFSSDILVHIYLREQSSLLASIYSTQVRSGRVRSIGQDMEGIKSDWWDDCLTLFAGYGRRGRKIAPEIQIIPAWLDFDHLLGMWENVFGHASIRLHPFSPAHLAKGDLVTDAYRSFGINGTGLKSIGRQNVSLNLMHSDKLRMCNAQLLIRGANEILLSTRVRNAIALEFEKSPDRTDPAALTFIRSHFWAGNQRIMDRYPDFPRDALPFEPVPEVAGFPEFDHGDFDAGKKVEEVLAQLAGREKPSAKRQPIALRKPAGGWPVAKPVARSALEKGDTGIVLVATMRDEGPFLLEWLAHHRAIGVDNFLIFTNDCQDGTDQMLDRLQDMGLLTHVRNPVAEGGVPHQEALNLARNHPMVRKSSWIIHIDADEFINIHIGDGTLPELLAAIGDANFLAMTWRLFGSCGIERFIDEPVVGQFVRCAPAYMPKPHTAWGFKTMYRNIGAYRKLGVHRPNKLNEEMRSDIRWVNGSGEPMPPLYSEDGWRSERSTIGYKLVTLNHYAVRSIEAFMVKRARGRANHASRSIGLNYWIRMDFNSVRETSMLRHLPRIRAEMAGLMEDAAIRGLHAASVDWYEARIAGLRQVPEFAGMLAEIKALKLTDAERIKLSMQILAKGDG